MAQRTTKKKRIIRQNILLKRRALVGLATSGQQQAGGSETQHKYQDIVIKADIARKQQVASRSNGMTSGIGHRKK